MSIESYIQALPKVELNLQFEGAFALDTILRLAEQNDIASTFKTDRQYKKWLELIKNPDMSRLDEILTSLGSCLKYADNLSFMVYHLGVALSKQNVRYAEISLNPAIYTDLGMGFDEMLGAINEGRDKAMRAWGVRMDWILTITRERSRKADDIARWTSSSNALRNHVTGLGLIGNEASEPIGEFARAFQTAERKGVYRVASAFNNAKSGDEVDMVVETLQAQRFNDVWTIQDDEEALTLLADEGVAIVLTPSRDVAFGNVDNLEAYPINKFMANNTTIVSSGMPEIFGMTLNDVLIDLVNNERLGVDDVNEMMLQAIDRSFLTTDEKNEMTESFTEAFATLRDEHLT